MRIRTCNPPNYEAVRERFGPLPDGVIFSYAPYVYVPSGVPLSPQLEAHEGVHIVQQGDDPEAWWDRYMADDAFRLAQEVAAHREEWRTARRVIKDRNRLTRERMVIARRLASPMYGEVVSVREALSLIKEAA